MSGQITAYRKPRPQNPKNGGEFGEGKMGPLNFSGKPGGWWNAVDGSEIRRSPVDMGKSHIIYDGFYTSQVQTVVVWYFFHQQYYSNLARYFLHMGISSQKAGKTSPAWSNLDHSPPRISSWMHAPQAQLQEINVRAAQGTRAPQS